MPKFRKWPRYGTSQHTPSCFARWYFFLIVSLMKTLRKNLPNKSRQDKKPTSTINIHTYTHTLALHQKKKNTKSKSSERAPCPSINPTKEVQSETLPMNLKKDFWDEINKRQLHIAKKNPQWTTCGKRKQQTQSKIIETAQKIRGMRLHEMGCFRVFATL